MKDRVIFHIDVNSAYLSWQATYNLLQGDNLDLREVPSVIGGSEKKRNGIVLAKSIPAKKYGIKTGETLHSARQKCRNLIVAPPNYSLYMKCSNAMNELFKEYTPTIQRFSVDESFLDFTNTDYLYDDYIKLAHEIKDRVKNELGFTVNIGISTNKLLAKMASDFQKPNNVHTLWKHEIKDKMWGLPIEDLYMVGRKTSVKLRQYNIKTIGDLAQSDVDVIKYRLKKHGFQIWNYANGIESSEVTSNGMVMKGVGNSTTIPYDVTEKETAHKILLSLTETVATRLRALGNACKVVSISIKDNEFYSYTRQKKLDCPVDTTNEIAREVYALFDKNWGGNPIRQLGVHVTDLCDNNMYQMSLFQSNNIEKNKKLDKTIDQLRSKYGDTIIVRSSFLHTGIKPLSGGIGEEYYLTPVSVL